MLCVKDFCFFTINLKMMTHAYTHLKYGCYCHFPFSPSHTFQVNNFFTLSASGQLSIYRSLKGTVDQAATESRYLMEAEIYDGGDPSLVGLTRARITVLVYRNRNCPQFSSLPDSINISENSTGVVYSVVATDADDNVRYVLYIFLPSPC